MSHDFSDRIIDAAERRRLVPYSNMHIWRLEKQGRFPDRIKLGEHRVGWSLLEVQQWINARKAERYDAVGLESPNLQADQQSTVQASLHSCTKANPARPAGNCQRQSNFRPAWRSKFRPPWVIRGAVFPVVPVVHRRDPRCFV